MHEHGLSREGLERVLGFEGYGRKTAPYWFVGIEEGGGSIEELRERAKKFERVEYLHSSHAKIGLDNTMYRHVPTWRVMSKLTMAMQGTSGWQDTVSAREYQAHKLGSADGDTFLTELMPLPCRSIGAWPYPMIYPTREDYNADIRPVRIKWLRSEVTASQPRFVICYGKGNWRHYEDIFTNVHFITRLDGKIRVGTRGHSTILLLPFLSYDLVTTALITQIACLFGRNPK